MRSCGGFSLCVSSERGDGLPVEQRSGFGAQMQMAETEKLKDTSGGGGEQTVWRITGFPDFALG